MYKRSNTNKKLIMEEFKISFFEAEHKIQFPFFKKLNSSECQNTLNTISKLYNLNKSNINNQLAAKQKNLSEVDANSDFHLIETLRSLGITSHKDVFINWNEFHNIDYIDLNILDKFFYNIWFPTSDDIDIFDDSFNWILSIRHDGNVSFITTF